MKVSLTTFRAFLQHNGRKFPYNQVRKTRRTFYPKWIVLQERHGRNVTLPSSTIDKETLNHLIISKQAWPLSPVMDEIVDYMDCWGRVENARWYQNVIDWIAYLCYNGIRRCNQGLLYDCAAMRLRDMVSRCAGATTELTRVILKRWRTEFFRMYDCGITDFATLYEESSEFVVNELENSIPTSHSAEMTM